MKNRIGNIRITFSGRDSNIHLMGNSEGPTFLPRLSVLHLLSLDLKKPQMEGQNNITYLLYALALLCL